MKSLRSKNKEKAYLKKQAYKPVKMFLFWWHSFILVQEKKKKDCSGWSQDIQRTIQEKLA